MNNYKFSFFFTSVILIIFCVLFFIFPSLIIDGLRKGLTVCGSSVIPSMFPFIVLSDFIIRSDYGNVIGSKISPITEKIFRLPGSAGCAIIMSLIGGFPIGAKMTAQLYENGEINESQGRRMIIFCVNAGPAFVIGTVGTTMLSSRRAGIILFVSLSVTSLLFGFVSRFFIVKSETKPTKIKAAFNPDVLSESVSNSIQTMFNICAWIMLFSGFNSLLLRLPVSRSAVLWLSMLTEVTNGCMNAAGNFPACILALTLGWAGLSVHFQVLPYLEKLKVRMSFFWISRLLAGGTATAISWLLFKLFPCETSVFSNNANIISEPFSISAPVAAAMLLLSALMLIDINPCKKEKNVIQ